MNLLTARFAAQARSLDAEHRLRKRVCVQQVSPAQLRCDGRDFVNFSSNDYLGLSQHPDIISALTQPGAASSGSGGSSLVTGYCQEHANLEAQLCEWLGYESALLFSSGFAANHGVLTGLLREGDNLIQDKLNHASLIDGGRASGARMLRFKHNDMAHFAQRLLLASGAPTLSVTEGVFSMDGDRAPLSKFLQLCQQHGSLSMLDDAHGIGALSPQGQGSTGMLENGQKPDILMITFGKALGTSGACVLSSKEVVTHLLQSCRHYIYSTAIAPVMAAATSEAIKVCQWSQDLRDKLAGNIGLFRQLAQQHALQLTDSDSAIQPVILGTNARALGASDGLRSEGFWVTAIRPPTVPPNSARLRITLSAAHTEAEIRQLVQSLAKQAIKN